MVYYVPISLSIIFYWISLQLVKLALLLPLYTWRNIQRSIRIRNGMNREKCYFCCYIFFQPKIEKFYIVSKTKPGSDCSWDHQLLIGKSRVKLKKVRKTIRPFSSVQFNSVAQSCLTLCDPMNCSMPGLPVPHQLPESTQTHFHQVDDAIQPSHPLSSASPLAFSLSQHQDLFRWVSLRIRGPKYWCFSFSISPSNEYSGLISFRIDWLDLSH